MQVVRSPVVRAPAVRETVRLALAAGALLALPLTAAAGDVSSKLVGDKLILNGSVEADELIIEHDDEGGPADLLVTAVAGTTIDGAPSASFAGIAELRLHLGEGGDEATIQGVTLTRSLDWQGGSGDDELLLQDCTIADDLMATPKQGADRLELDGCSVLSTLRMNGSSGNDSITLDDDEVGRLDANMGSGTNSFSLSNSSFEEVKARSGPDITQGTHTFTASVCTVHGDLSAIFGTVGGNFTLTTLTVEGHLRIRTGNRDDSLNSTGLHVDKDARLELGSGQNDASLISPFVADELRYRGGSHGDLLSLVGIDVGSLDVKLPGKDQGQLNGSPVGSVAGEFELVTGSASNVLGFDGLSVGGTARISSGGDDDVVSAGGTYQSDLKIFTGPGDDGVHLGSSVIMGSVLISTAGGDDVVTTDTSTVSGETKIDTGPGNDVPE